MSGASAIVLALGWHIQSSGSLAGVLALICVAGVVTSIISRRAIFSRGFHPDDRGDPAIAARSRIFSTPMTI